MTGAEAQPETIRLGPRQTLTVRSSTPEVLKLECEWQPGTPPPTHWHPRQHEHFEVLEGELTVGMWNAGPGTCRATWLITPAQRTEEMFRFMADDPGPLSKASVLVRFRDELRLGTPRR